MRTSARTVVEGLRLAYLTVNGPVDCLTRDLPLRDLSLTDTSPGRPALSRRAYSYSDSTKDGDSRQLSEVEHELKSDRSPA